MYTADADSAFTLSVVYAPCAHLACFIDDSKAVLLQGNLLTASPRTGGEHNAGSLQRCLDCFPVQEASMIPNACASKLFFFLQCCRRCKTHC